MPSLLLVGPLPPPAGGMANQTRQLMRLLQGEGISVQLVQTNAPYRPAWIETLRGLRAVFRLVPYVWRLWRACGSVQVMHVMANSGWAWFLLAAPAIHIASLRRVPVVINYRGGLAAEFLERSAARVAPTLRRAGRVVVPSRFLQEIFARYGVSTEIIPNIVDLEMFHPADTPASGVHVVVARNLEAIYGIDTAIRALVLLVRDVPNVKMSIAGSGPERAQLQSLCTELGLSQHVTFVGRLDVGQMAELYRSADVVLNPSRVDNTPNSILEALACGVPVVSTRAGGVPYLVDHGQHAWLVPVDAVAEMAAALKTMLQDTALRAQLRSNGLRLAATCGWNEVKARWLDTYRVLARSPERH